MRTLLIILFGLVIIAGCVGTPPGEIPKPPQENETDMTCEEYCPTLPHIQCVGEWNISGTYPDCNCSFECTVTENETEQNETADQNETDVIADNETEQNETEDPYAFIEPSDKTIDEILDEAIANFRTDFYSDHSGLFQEDKYKWKRIPGNASPGDIVFDAAPPSDVKFDDEVIQTIQGCAFVVFTDEDENTDAYGLAVFTGTATMLDSYTGTDAFSVNFFSPVVEKDFHDCWVTSKELSKNPEEALISTYFIECETVVDK